MADQTKGGIAWTEQTWNPIRGCSRVSEGCRHCYAETVAHRFSGPGQPYEGLTTPDGRWNGIIRPVPEHLKDPLHWKRPRMVFVNSMSDLFHENLPFSEIDKVFEVMARAREHTFQVLTKRVDRMKAYLNASSTPHHQAYAIGVWPLPNVWIGVSVEDQQTADERIPVLLQTQGAVRWVSYEPALGPVDFKPYFGQPGLDWGVFGGESGSGARPFELAWGRVALRQFKTAGVPAFMKQLGALAVAHGPLSLKDRKGGDMAEWPEDMRVREYPKARS